MKMFENIDLLKEVKKYESNDSERIVDPAITTNLAIDKLESINCKYDVEYYNIDNIYYISELKYLNPFDMNLQIQPAGVVNGGYSSMGKGSTPEQCTASMYMEAIERISLWQHMREHYPVYKGLNLRTHKVDKVVVDTSSSEMVAAGNTYEEAVLHGLHEMIEVESISKNGLNKGGSSITANLQPYKIVNIKDNFPEWIDSSFTILQIPNIIPEFYSFISIRYPINEGYSNDWEMKSGEDGVWSKQTKIYSDWRGNKDAYVFSASGINPNKAISRCIQESFQGPERYRYNGIKKDPPNWIEQINISQLTSYETKSIVGDIKFIIDKIPENFNIWAVDLTSPELGVPVIKIVTDYHFPTSMGQKDIINLFYDMDGNK